jgi:hypothetical protein
MSQSVEGPLELELQHLVLILDSASFVIYVLSILVSVWLALKVLWCRINEKIHFKSQSEMATREENKNSTFPEKNAPELASEGTGFL